MRLNALAFAGSWRYLMSVCCWVPPSRRLKPTGSRICAKAPPIDKKIIRKHRDHQHAQLWPTVDLARCESAIA
ncbi:hypothetical protein DL95DRAFT_387809 [Leptodontidium sp. 2 PMI_412]|nr:hypothetical protein DL95DRAFT_387809 [Leptodontidium sp. 2 PMI_412]